MGLSLKRYSVPNVLNDVFIALCSVYLSGIVHLIKRKVEMEAKKNLNNVQRKMLDEIYSEQFKAIEQATNNQRTKDRQKLEAKLLKDFAKNKDVKAYLEAGKKFFELAQKLKPVFNEKGVNTSDYISKAPELSVNYGWRNEYKTFPELEKFNEETIRIEGLFAQRKREMRAKIYGLNTTYEEAEAEIKELLKDIL